MATSVGREPGGARQPAVAHESGTVPAPHVDAPLLAGKASGSADRDPISMRGRGQAVAAALRKLGGWRERCRILRAVVISPAVFKRLCRVRAILGNEHDDTRSIAEVARVVGL